jgi:hypothetical protein
MPGLDKQKIGQLGVNSIERIIIAEWKSRWQAIDGFNDDGIDGLIFIERASEHTGQIIHVQVKCGRKKANRDGWITIAEETARLRAHLSRWKRVVGASILVYVDADTGAAYWRDLKDPENQTKSQVKVHVSRKFNQLAKKEISLLCGTIHRDVQLECIKTNAQDFEYLVATKSIDASARQFFRQLNSMRLMFDKVAEPIRFTREGWKHITRRGRSKLKRLQCLQLLGVIPKAVAQTSALELRAIKGRGGIDTNKVYMIVAATFPFRGSTVLKLIFLKREMANGSNYSFYSIYEPRRGRNIVGA